MDAGWKISSKVKPWHYQLTCWSKDLAGNLKVLPTTAGLAILFHIRESKIFQFLLISSKKVMMVTVVVMVVIGDGVGGATDNGNVGVDTDR